MDDQRLGAAVAQDVAGLVRLVVPVDRAGIAAGGAARSASPRGMPASLRSMIATTSPSPMPSCVRPPTPRSARSPIVAPSRCTSPAMTVATIVPPAGLFVRRNSRAYSAGLCSRRKADPHCGTACSSAYRAIHSVTRFMRVRARRRIGSDMDAAGAAGGECHAGALLQRQVRVVEVVIGVGIDHDRRLRAASARARHHLLAGARRGPVVLGADQDQGRQARAPGGVAQAAAAGEERDRGAEVGLCLLLPGARPHGPERRDRAIGPADQRHAVRPRRSSAPAASGAPRPRRPPARVRSACCAGRRCTARRCRARRSCPGTAPRSRRPRAVRPSRRSGWRPGVPRSPRPSQLCSATIAGNGPLPAGR